MQKVEALEIELDRSYQETASLQQQVQNANEKYERISGLI